jgi:DNA-binding transcriptional MerR regulator
MRIAQAARQVGISSTTLKRLERRGLIHPRKDRNGQRRYTDRDIEQIRALYYPPAPPATAAALDAADCTA